MRRNLDIDLLRTFHAVAQLKQFKAAAQHIHRSPAAVSVQIQRLEALVGGRLFERDTQSVQLTALGNQLLHHSQILLRQHDKIWAQLGNQSNTVTLRLGLPDEYTLPVLERVLPRFYLDWPQVELEITCASSIRLQQLVTRQRIDLALVVQQNMPINPVSSLESCQPVWVCSTHSSDTMPSVLPLALHPQQCPYRSAMLHALDTHHYAWRAVLTSHSSQAIQACVESGLGISVIDRRRVTPKMRIIEQLPDLACHYLTVVGEYSEPAAHALALHLSQYAHA